LAGGRGARLVGLGFLPRNRRAVNKPQDLVQGVPAGLAPQPNRRKLPWNIQRWDDNANGKLDEREMWARDAYYRRQEKQKRRHDALREWDENRDGRLDLKERAAMQAAVEAEKKRQEEILRRWDKDRDGRLGEKERYLMFKCAHASRKQYLLGRFDKDRNKELDEKEMKAVEEYYSKRYDLEAHQRMLRRYDRNRDGKLDARERAVMAADKKKAAGGKK